MAGTYRMGFEGPIYFGSAGSTASTAIEESADWSYNITHERGDTTTRGAGSTPPISTFRVTGRVASITFQMKRKASDSTLASLLSAVAAGTTVAIRTKDNSSGSGFDGDVTLEVNQGTPLRGEQTLEFTCYPNRDTREPLLWT